MKLDFKGKCNTDREEIDKNLSANQWVPRVSWGAALYPPCAVVGAGPSLEKNIPLLKEWIGDIFAINDTAGYLSDHGIASYLYMMDASNEAVKRGIHIKGAVLASRCNPVNFIYNNTRCYDMLDDCIIPGYFMGVEGGGSAPCRAPHLFLRMGYRGIAFFGCDSSFFDTTHLSGERKEAKDFLIIVRVQKIDYITNAAMFMQAQWLSERMLRHPNLLLNFSDGLLKAMVQSPGAWEIVAVGEDLRKFYKESGVDVWNKPYERKRDKVWQPNA
jgi:hypothetical protein